MPRAPRAGNRAPCPAARSTSCVCSSPPRAESGDTTTAASTGTETTSPTTDPATTGTSEAPTTSGDSSSSTTTSGESSSSTNGEASSGTTGSGEDLEMQAEDFTCILEWEKVRKFRITNLLGHTDEALEVANNPAGGTYPVGTVIQLIPGEAMVKRAAGWAPDNSDWEFFALDVTAEGTTIMARGTQDVVNGFGGNCFDCHAKAAPQWDRICEEGHGCDPLPFTPEQIEMVQMADPRCP
ncbi:hypothetical protein OV079_30355 [Nannocystis pusilla]|uniref:Cytochrome P460 domain-containing protein n=1 Tax=Nannocystis pusilla TaxID=889268 RepID=A0A9X3EUR3_9BACT|nr:hypothetical protein [Nannocystis pusilla]MCY1009789.1 hypothetical protein [Nannocystis pusilla]